MNKNLKNKINKMNLILVCSAVLLTSCGTKKEEKEEVSKKIEFVNKETKYKKDETTEVLIDSPKIKKEDITKIIKHGDHWHVFTKDGKEHITYVDPEKMGSDDSMALVSVVSKNLLKGLNVNSIKKHGDHWHVYTADGREFLTYEDPSSLFPNIAVGTYVGNHGDSTIQNISTVSNNSNASNLAVTPTVIEKNGDEVVRILKHEDHWHIYTANGMEYVSYSNPSSKYPNVPIGTYVGSHGDLSGKNENKKPDENKKPIVDNGSSTLIDTDLPSGLVRVIENTEALKKLDLKEIKKHGDHYHLYTKNNVEYITHSKEIEKLFPNIEITEYIGNHGQESNENIAWPEDIVRIVDHGDHWHLYNSKGEETVVKVNPKSRYPKAEYIVEKGEDYSDYNIDDSEIFSYGSVESKLVKGVVPYLNNNLLAMTDFGSLDTNIPVYGSENETKNIFYWLHGNHYHAITIKQLVQMEKAGKFGKFTAKDVVSTLKYKIENPTKPLEAEVTVDKYEVHKYLMDLYGFTDKRDVEIIGNLITIYLNGDSYYFNLADFEKVDGNIRCIKELPKAENKKVENKENESVPTEENTEKEDIKEENKRDKEKPKKEDEALKNEKLKKQQENTKKLMDIFKVSEDEALEKIYDIIGNLKGLDELIINPDGTASYNGKTYDLKNIKKVEEPEEIEEVSKPKEEKEETENTDGKENIEENSVEKENN